MGWYRFLPLVMAAWNVCFVVVTLMTEYRLKVNCLRYAVLYAMTVLPAMRGNYEPFFMVLTMPQL